MSRIGLARAAAGHTRRSISGQLNLSYGNRRMTENHRPWAKKPRHKETLALIGPPAGPAGPRICRDIATSYAHALWNVVEIASSGL